MDNKTLSKLDLEHIWHPCTQMKDHETLPLIPIKRGKGIYLYDFDGNSYMDCVSSWWVNLFGHSNDYINEKLKFQLENLEHVILAGFTHEPIITLSKRLCELLPSNLNKCFYADNGSSAIEVALKMSFHAHLNKNHKRHKFLSLSNSYHGETLGALSIGDVDLYKEIYTPLLLECIQTPVPKSEDFSEELEILRQILKEQGEQICAFILEPLIQCAGNMHMYSANFITAACKMCKEFGIDIIFDEIAVGFGRSGSMFALEQCGIVPDFLCLSKGITAGYMPLSVVITSDEIYQIFYAPYESKKAFLHSHSYTGNTLACAAANATLDIFETQNVIEKNKHLSQFIYKEFTKLKKFDFLGNFRQKGMIFAFDILKSQHERVGIFVFQEALKKGLLLRPLANTIYFMPPYIIQESEISYVVASLEEIFSKF